MIRSFFCHTHTGHADFERFLWMGWGRKINVNNIVAIDIAGVFFFVCLFCLFFVLFVFCFLF